MYVSKDGKSFIQGTVYDINKSPFQENVDKLKTDLQPSFGPAGAPVTIVVFSDFQCPVCKEEAQVLRQNLTKAYPDKVRLYFKDFPLESDPQLGADRPPIAGRCVFKQNPQKFWDYFDWMYDQQANIGLDNINDKLQMFATEKGRRRDATRPLRRVEGERRRGAKEIAEGHALQSTATPTIFINGRKIENATAVEYARHADQDGAGSPGQSRGSGRQVLRSLHAQDREVR